MKELAAAIEKIADAVEHIAECWEETNKHLREIVTCACSVDARGEIADYPTIQLKFDPVTMKMVEEDEVY